MTNNTITVMKKELARFFGDRRLVITTLLLPGIMIYVVYSLSLIHISEPTRPY